MSNQRANTAMVGVGAWGKNLARNFHQLGALYAICDASTATLKTFEELYPGVKTYSDYEALLDDPQVERVALASPAFAHYDMALKALQAGKDVYVEKPLCLNTEEAETLVRLADENDRILMVGHLLRYHPCIQKLLELVGKGKLGQVHYIFSNRLDLGRFRQEENALWNFAPHDLSMILALAGNQLPEKVRCNGMSYVHKDVADMSLMTLSFAKKLRAHISVSWLNPYKEQRLVVIGEEGTAVFDDTLPWEEKLKVFWGQIQRNDDGTAVHHKSAGEAIVLPQSEPLRNECSHFLECCELRKTPITDGHEALRVIAVLEALQQSQDADGEAKEVPELALEYV